MRERVSREFVEKEGGKEWKIAQKMNTSLRLRNDFQVGDETLIAWAKNPITELIPYPLFHTVPIACNLHFQTSVMKFKNRTIWFLYFSHHFLTSSFQLSRLTSLHPLSFSSTLSFTSSFSFFVSQPPRRLSSNSNFLTSLCPLSVVPRGSPPLPLNSNHPGGHQAGSEGREGYHWETEGEEVVSNHLPSRPGSG